ncbi:hypothetical protein [Streptomyces sp. G45]|uniref:hypothetical protein n=1 Tax=Streptomyces sp. G45 TaxID=3406627 RepID=UPI003C20B40D
MLWASLLADEVSDCLERILGRDAVPLTPQESERSVRLLSQCAWGLVSEALQQDPRHPDDDLVLQIRFAADLHLERDRRGLPPDAGFVRRLGLLVLNLLDRQDAQDEPLPTFAEPAPVGRQP